MGKNFKKALSLLVAMIIVLGSVAVGGEGFSQALNAFVVKAFAESGEYTLTVNYVTPSGIDAPASYTGQVYTGETYNVVTPEMEGLTPDTPVVTGTMGEEDVTVTVTYAANSYTVTFMDGNNTVSTSSVKYGQSITRPSSPKKKNWYFAGWSPEVPSSMPADNMVFHATWTKYYVDDVVTFGSYPQTNINSDNAPEVYAALQAMENSLSWVSYGYYSNGSPSDYMKYCDVDYNGEKYRAVIFSAYRPSDPSSKAYTSASNGLSLNTVYWYKWEPLNWYVQKMDGTLKSVNIIDSQYINNTGSYSGFETSQLKNWLNNNFYNTAFNNEEKLHLINLKSDTDIKIKPGDSHNGFTNLGPYPLKTDYATSQGNSAQTNCYFFSGGFASSSSYGVSDGTNGGYSTNSNTLYGVRVTIRLDYLIVVPQDYTITWNVNENITSSSVTEGCDIVFPNPDVKKNAKFVGWEWKKTDSDIPIEGKDVMPDYNITVTAKYAEKDFNITFKSDGDVYKEIGFDEGDEILLPEEPTRNGYAFLGWTPSVPDIMPAEDLIVSARWLSTQLKGSTFTLGSYPQTEVTDTNTLEALNSLVEGEEWESYEYHLSGVRESSDFMRYIDVDFSGNKYRGVIFDEYRDSNQNQLTNGYSINTVYWFKYEPLRWSVVNSAKGLVVCQKAIDAQSYSRWSYRVNTEKSGNKSYADESLEHYTNDYTVSFIRRWLNEDFYNTAFTDDEKKAIITTSVICQSEAGTNEPFYYGPVKDKIFIPDNIECSSSKVPTDYSKCQCVPCYTSNNQTLARCMQRRLVKYSNLSGSHYIFYTSGSSTPTGSYAEIVPAMRIVPAINTVINEISVENMDLYIGESKGINLSTVPQSYSDTISYQSSNSSIASVDSNGVVTGISEGIAVITLTTTTGITEECKVAVSRRNTKTVTWKIDGNTVATSEVEVGQEITVINAADYVSLAEGRHFSDWTGLPAGNIMPNADVEVSCTTEDNVYIVIFANDPDFPVDNTAENEAAATTVTHGGQLVLPVALTNVPVGYGFGGWTDGAHTYKNGDTYAPTSKVHGDTVAFTPVWDAIYVVNFYVNGALMESLDETDGITIGEPVGDARVPGYDQYKEEVDYPDGYEIVGWSTTEDAEHNGVEADIVDPVDDMLMPAVDELNFYAVIKAKDYGDRKKVSFNHNEGKDPETVEEVGGQVYDSQIVGPADDPTRTGYAFIGWAETADATGADYTTATLPILTTDLDDADVTFYAIWNAMAIPVEYYVDGMLVYRYIVPFNEPYTVEDYSAEGIEDITVWTVGTDTVNAGSDYTFTEDDWDNKPVKFEATSVKVEYAATFDLDGGAFADDTETGERTYYAGETITVPADPTKAGNVFIGWYNEDGYTVEGAMPAADVTFTALWTEKVFDITYTDGTTTQTLDDVPYSDIENTEPNLDDFDNEGMHIDGWEIDDGQGGTVPYTPENVEKYADSTTGAITVTAVLAPNSYKITYVTDGTAVPEATYDFGDVVDTSVESTKDGYTFDGWTYDPALGTGDTMPASDVTATAIWITNRYKVSYILDGQPYGNPSYDEFDFNTLVSVRDKPVKEGYIVNDWSFTPALADGRMPAGDVVANATSSANTYKITFTYGEVYSGAVYKEIEAEYGSPITVPEDPEFSGFIFSGWDKDIPETMPAEDITINALWLNGTFTVTYKVDGEKYFKAPYESASDTFIYGEPVTVREKAVKEGYTVSDWTFTPALEDGKMPAGNVIASAASTINTYTVTWIVNGNSTVERYEFGAEIIIPEGPSIPGKIFKGWSGEIPASMPARNLVFVASFDAITHTATFVVPDENGSYIDETGTYEVVDTRVFEEGQTAIAEPAVPERDGYTGRWEDYTISTADIVIKAIYTIKDSNDIGEVETDKTAGDNGDGTVTITLDAYSDAQSIFVEGENEPLDIVLVVDQSGSMGDYMDGRENAPAGQRRRDYLVNTATSFVNSVKQNAEETGADHRISIVGFAMGSQSASGISAYENTEVLTTLNDSPVKYSRATNENYRKSLMSVTDSYSHILAAINNIEAEGATAADLGFDMAASVFAQNNSDRKKVIIFLTDGEPTTTNTFDEGVANKAITYSKNLKAQGVTVYSIAISDIANPADSANDFNKFLHATSSNYKYASSIWHLDDGNKDNGYFLSVRDANALQKIFDNIYVRSVAKTLNFSAVTLYDTVKREFTMTIPQEQAFRENMIAKYGISNSDITVDRRNDGTTYIEVRNLTPYAYYDSTNVMQGWKTDVAFDVTANENALNAGDYLTNTDEAGVIVGGYNVAEFESPEVTIPADRYIVEFLIGDEVYEIREMSFGDEIIAPECNYATWTIPEGTTVSSEVTKYFADLGEKDRTVIWHIGDETITQNYATGEKITAPEVNEEGKSFTGWSPSVESYMGYIDLEYTATFSEHVHNYKKTASSGLCTEGRKVTYTCPCGESYTEILPACEHKLETTVYETDTATITHIFCTECSYSEDKVLTFKTANSGSYGWWNYYSGSTVASFDLYNDVNGGEIHNLDENQYLYIRVPVSSLNTESQQAIRQGRTINIIHYLENGRTEKCPYAVDGDYIVVQCTSFSYYVFTTQEVDENVTNASFDCMFEGQHQFRYVYNNDATTDADGTETEVCSHCGATGETRTAEGTKLRPETIHTDLDRDGKCDDCGEDVIQGFTVSGTKVLRGKSLDWTVTTLDCVDTIRLRGTYITENGTKKTLTYIYKLNQETVNLNITDNEGVRTWNIRMPFTFSADFDDLKIDETWSLSYKNDGLTKWNDFSETKAISVFREECYMNENTSEYEPFTLVSAAGPENVQLNKFSEITVVTTSDCSKVRISVNGKNATYMASSTNCTATENDDGTTTWVIRYKFTQAGENTYSVSTRGPAWSEATTFTTTVG